MQQLRLGCTPVCCLKLPRAPASAAGWRCAHKRTVARALPHAAACAWCVRMCCCLLNVVLHRLLLLFLCIRVLRCPQQL